ncbi:fungal-specific transcription factor domain-containing protein [Mycena epipterygia]|nr:fungal-specific transcription factor domain-containing protein [Mycena epipterygia]
MPSNDEDSYEGEFEATSKQKRVRRACDMCRHKKRNGGDICDHCAKHKFICTYVKPSPQARPLAVGNPIYPDLPNRSYVEVLEARVKTLEARLEQTKTEKNPGLQVIRNAVRGLNSPLPAPHSDDSTVAEIDESFRALSIDNFSVDQGFHGKSSGAILVKVAVDLRDGAKNTAAVYKSPRTVESRQAAPVPPYSFPEDGVLMSFISFYFEYINPFLPLLHRQTFESGVKRNLHLNNGGFAKTVLLACALGALYSTEPQTPARGPDNVPPAPPGWKWFEQIDQFKHMVHSHPTLYDLQSYCLGAAYVNCACPRAAWTLVGSGIRLAQDIGAHRFKLRDRENNLEQELEKRASWALWLFDTQMSTALGRSNAFQAWDFDIDMPITCDDDDCNIPISTFIPTNKPSVTAFFNSMLHLNHILSFSCTVLYTTKRKKILLGVGDGDWEEQVIAEFDGALDTWFETIPDHLRWDPDHPIEDDIFFDQSAVLYCMYYHTRIIIHRPLIHAMRSPQRLHSLTTPLFSSAVVLLLNIWGGSASNKTTDKDLVDIHHCMGVLAAQQHQWPAADHLLDTLRPLIAGERSPTEGLGADSAPEIEYPNLQSELQLGLPFPVGISPPAYDPHLETAPHYPDVDSLDNAVMSSSDTYIFSGEEQNYMYGHDLAFVPQGNPHASIAEDFDVNMMDAHTIALWSRAPSNFGIADWDISWAIYRGHTDL